MLCQILLKEFNLLSSYKKRKCTRRHGGCADHKYLVELIPFWKSGVHLTVFCFCKYKSRRTRENFMHLTDFCHYTKVSRIHNLYFLPGTILWHNVSLVKIRRNRHPLMGRISIWLQGDVSFLLCSPKLFGMASREQQLLSFFLVFPPS